MLKERSTDWMEKIKMVEGSLEQPDLGLSEENLQLIINDVSLVFHIAATIKFDAPIRYICCSVNVTLIFVLCHRHMSMLPLCASYVNVTPVCILCQCYPCVRPMSMLPPVCVLC